jgi:8-oxo-dGTP pyrophosphatase MutT (NUDIX family)
MVLGMSKSHIEVIVRGVLVDGGALLLCRNRKRGHVFLPGGHVEFGEPARVALEREIQEELGLAVHVGDFLGLSEARFPRPRPRPRSSPRARNSLHPQSDPCPTRPEKPDQGFHEVNILFGIQPKQPLLRGPGAVVSREEHIEFLWRPLDELAKAVADDHPDQVLPPSILNIVLAAYRPGNADCWFVSDWS